MPKTIFYTDSFLETKTKKIDRIRTLKKRIMNQHLTFLKKDSLSKIHRCKMKNVFTVCKYSNIKLHLNFLYLTILKKDDLMRTLTIIITLASMILNSSFVSEHKYFVSITT